MHSVLFNSYSEIAAADWDGLLEAHCAHHCPSADAHEAAVQPAPQPFLQHAFLLALESSGSATARSGWLPQILTVWQGERLEAALPMYAKMHSMGEFVFDWSWAEAYARHGLAYYPKLVAAVPFSPVQGARLLARNAEARTALLAAALRHAEDGQFSSLHILFPEPHETALLEAQGLMIRRGVQFHWHNPGYTRFEDYLAALTRDKRKKIRQERRRVTEAGITFKQLSGSAITPAAIDFAYRCYANTYTVRGRDPYLTPAFFQQLCATQGEHVLLVLAIRDGEPIAMALNLYNRDTLWGRYWGYAENVPCLHFETCYYQAIEFCIARGITLFEGGAQGEHKLARGFLPVTTSSAHWVAHPEFRNAISLFLQRETQGITEYLDELDEHSPFKQTPA